MKCKCGSEMQDMGHWPNHSYTGVNNRWHCKACNVYHSEPVPSITLKENSNGTFSEVTA